MKRFLDFVFAFIQTVQDDVDRTKCSVASKVGEHLPKPGVAYDLSKIATIVGMAKLGFELFPPNAHAVP